MMYSYEYPRPMFTVDTAVFYKQNNIISILLIKRKNYPYENYWALPGGFVEMDETIEKAAARELFEETGLEGLFLKQFHTYGDTKRDPRGRTISTIYYGFYSEEGIKIKAGDDAAEAKWFNVNQLPELAFDHHQIIEDIKIFLDLI